MEGGEAGEGGVEVSTGRPGPPGSHCTPRRGGGGIEARPARLLLYTEGGGGELRPGSAWLGHRDSALSSPARPVRGEGGGAGSIQVTGVVREQRRDGRRREEGHLIVNSPPPFLPTHPITITRP